MTDGLTGIATQVLPLYGVILLAWAVGGRMEWAPRVLSTVLVYALIPVLVIDKVLQAEAAELKVIPPLMFAVAAAMSLPAWWLSRRLGDDFDPRLLSASFSFFNVAFFGIPVATALFDEAAVSTIICAYVGSALYGDTIGYYLVARTKEGRARAASKALRIPLFYAFVLGLILKVAGVEVPGSLEPASAALSTTVSVLGMGVIGFNLSVVRARDLDARLLAKIVAIRQAAAIVLMGAALAIEAAFIGTLGARERVLVGLIGLFPIAANVSLFASLLDTRKRDAALLVALSSVVSLVLVAAAVLVFGDAIATAG